MSLVIFCFLFSSIYYVPVKGEIIWYLSLNTMEFYTAERKKELIPFATAWIELESIMLTDLLKFHFKPALFIRRRKV